MPLHDVSASAGQSAKAKVTAGNYTTTSTSFVDVDATNLSLTIRTRGGRVLIVVTGLFGQSGSGMNCYMDVAIDGAREGGTIGLFSSSANSASVNPSASWSYITDALSAGIHTFKLQWAVSGGTGTLFASATAPVVFSVIELPI